MNAGDTKLETLQQTEEGALSEPSGSDSPANRSSKQLLQIAGGAILILGAVYWAFVEPKIRSTLVTVIIAVATSAGIWIGANLLFNQVRERWLRFSTILFAVIGALVGIVLHGNLVTVGSGSGFLTWVVGPLLGAAGFGAAGSMGFGGAEGLQPTSSSPSVGSGMLSTSRSHFAETVSPCFM